MMQIHNTSNHLFSILSQFGCSGVTISSIHTPLDRLSININMNVSEPELNAFINMLYIASRYKEDYSIIDKHETLKTAYSEFRLLLELYRT